MSILSFLGMKKREATLLIDIGNGSLSGAIVFFKKGELPQFLYGVTLPLPIAEKPDAMRLLSSMSNLLETLLTTIQKQGWANLANKNIKPGNIVVSLSSPWFIVKTKNLHIEKEEPFTVTSSFINDISRSEESLFKDELSKDFDGSTPDSFSIVETSIVHTKINGYSINNSIGKKTKILDASICMSAVPRDVKEKIIGIILKQTHIHENNVFIHPFPLVFFSAIRDNFVHEGNFVLMDITSEITDIALVEDNAITKTASFPFGKNFIIRQISRSLNITTEIAESMISMYIAKNADDSTVRQVETSIQEIEKEWSIYLEDTLLTLSPSMLLPQKLYITGDSVIAPIFLDFIKLPKSDLTSEFRKNINLIYIGKLTLADFYKNESNTQVDEFISMLALFYNKVI